MDTVVTALGGLIAKAVPTLLLLVLLHFYLKWAFYGPMDRLLERRWAATEGARKAAEESFRLAEEKATRYEEALRNARAEIFAEQEQQRARLGQQQAQAVREARRRTEALVKQARVGIEAEMAAARQALEAESDALAEQIAAVLLAGRAN